MNKKIEIILLIFFIFLTGCDKKINQNDNIERFYLEDKYYNNSSFVDIDENIFNNLNNENYILFVYNNYCTLPISCEEVFKNFMKKYDISFVSMPFKSYRNTIFYNDVKYAPSIIIVKEGSIVSYLDANKDEDLDKYQNLSVFEKWLNNYIYFSKN